MEKIKGEIGKFFIAGLIVVAVDALIYYFLLFILSPLFSKAIAFIFGTITAYLLNKFWTFKKLGYSRVEIIKFISLYALAMVINVGINSLILFILNSLSIAYLLATATSASFNFVGQKFFVFKRNA